jgi:hypothetical protein
MLRSVPFASSNRIMNHDSLIAAERNMWSTSCKAVMQDAASRSSDPEPLFAEDQPIAISIMATPPSSLCLARSRRIMGMRGSRQPASLQHLLSAGLLASHAPQASHASKKSADSRDLLAWPVSGGMRAAVPISVGQKQVRMYMCAIRHSIVFP